MLEALLLAAATAAATPAAKPTAAPPSAELLEFLAEWSEEDAKLIDTPRPVKPAPRKAPTAKKKETTP